jgi:hypothetical protein
MSDGFGAESKQVVSNLHVIGARVVRACHTCRHERREGDERDDERWCDASGKELEDTRGDDDLCGPDLSWWEPKPQQPMTPPHVPLLARLKRWLVG